MVKKAGADDEERLMNAVKRLTGIQKSILELNREANRIRTHIKDFDVNMEALNILANVRSRDEQGGGVRVLEDLIGYARQTGTPIDTGEVRDVPRTHDQAVAPPAEVEKRIEHPGEPASRRLLKLLTQLAVAAAVTSGLFVLIH